MKKFFYKIRSSSRKAFTLTEVLVSMAVLVMVIFASTSLVVAAIRSNKDNSNTIIAYGLAQEGIEAVRNMRDSDWLLNAKFNGEVGSGGVQIWGAKFPGNGDGEAYFTIEGNSGQQAYVPFFQEDSAVNDPVSLINYAPWKLKDITAICNGSYGQCADTLLFKVKDDSQLVRYVHGSGYRTAESAPTPFHRYLKVKAVPYNSGSADLPISSTKFLKMKVESVVEWKDFSRDRKVVLDTELTDWKPIN